MSLERLQSFISKVNSRGPLGRLEFCALAAKCGLMYKDFGVPIDTPQGRIFIMDWGTLHEEFGKLRLEVRG